MWSKELSPHLRHLNKEWVQSRKIGISIKVYCCCRCLVPNNDIKIMNSSYPVLIKLRILFLRPRHWNFDNVLVTNFVWELN